MTLTVNLAVADRRDDGAVDHPSSPRAGRPRRRRFTAEYKLAVVEEYDRLTEPGAKGALLRREGLYSSHVVEWRRARDGGALSALAVQVRRPGTSAGQVELERMRARAERAETELAKTRAVSISCWLRHT